MKKILLIILLCSTYSLFAQQIKSWNNYTNLKIVNDFESDGNTFWAATEGGIFSFSPSDSSYLILTKSEGLSSQTITAISIDQVGKIWIGTSEGYIDVYNPATGEINTIYEIYKENKSNKRINDIHISNDTAFVSTEFGLSLVNTNSLSFFDSILKFGEFSFETPVLKIYKKDKIYVVLQAGIAINKSGFSNLTAPEAWDNIHIEADIPATQINDVVILNNELYAATNKGIFKNSNNTWGLAYLSNSIVLELLENNNQLYSIVGNYDSKNEKYIGASLFKNGTTTEEIFKFSSGLLTKVKILEDNSFLLGSYSGLVEINNSTKYIFPNAPGTNSTISLTVDGKGNLWSGTGKDGRGIGVLKFDRENWEIIGTTNNSLFTFNDYHKVSSSDNAVYFSSWGRGFIRFRNNEYKSFNASNTNLVGIPGANTFIVINDVKEDLNGNAWFLNYWAADKKPISVLTPDDEIISFEIPNTISSLVISVENLEIDQYDTKWITGDYNGDAEAEGLFYFNDNGTLSNTNDDVWGKLTTSNGLRNNDVKDIAIDKFGELIIATSIGVDVITNPSDPKTIRGDQYYALRQQTVNCVAVDPINQKWFGTEKGVFLTNSDGSILLANFTKANSPLPTDVIKSIAIDEKNGIVYIGTDYGITAISTYFTKPNSSFSDLSVYPNPVLLSSNIDPYLIIDGLIEDSQIKIFNIAGELINEFSSIGGKTTYWDCKDLKGKLLSSGIYIVVAYDSEVNEVGHAKFAVLRK